MSDTMLWWATASLSGLSCPQMGAGGLGESGWHALPCPYPRLFHPSLRGQGGMLRVWGSSQPETTFISQSHNAHSCLAPQVYMCLPTSTLTSGPNPSPSLWFGPASSGFCPESPNPLPNPWGQALTSPSHCPDNTMLLPFS